ncbi:MAG: hypothetical protein HQ592_09570 [Planctomycetes bacterium]|nr:hypothetical protein [Planctomycetota bacterium]
MAEQKSTKTTTTLLWIAAALTAVAAALVMTGIVRVGVRGQWDIRPTDNPTWSGLFLAVPALGLVVLLAGAAWGEIESARRHEEIITVAMLIVFLVAMQFAVGALGEFGAQEAFLAIATPPTTNVYFSEAGKIDDPLEYLRIHDQRAAESENWQLKTHPPGPVLFFYCIRSAVKACPALKNAALGLAEKLIHSNKWRDEPAFAFLDRLLDRDAEAAAWLGVALLRFAAALSALPLYLLVRATCGKQKALVSAAVGGLIPSLLLFNTTVDQLYPLIGLAAVLLGYHAAARRSMLLNIVAGLVLFVGGMFTISFAVFFVVILVAQAWMLLAGAKKDQLVGVLRRFMLMAECLGIGVLVGMVAVYIASGFDFLAIRSWGRCLSANAAFNATSDRTYVTWLVANPVMFLVFLGVPAAVLFLGRAVGEGRALIEERKLPAADAMTVAVVSVLAALWLYGANLGEVERLWMPLMPLCVMIGIGRFGGLDRTGALILIGLQGLQAIVFKLGLDPLSFRRIIEQMTDEVKAVC